MLWVVYPGNQSYQLADKIKVIPLADVENITKYIL